MKPIVNKISVSRLFLLTAIILFFPCLVTGQSNEKFSKSVNYSLEELVEFAKKRPCTEFSPQIARASLDCLLNNVDDFKPKKMGNATPAYHHFEVKSSLSKLMRYLYNPDIPMFMTMPSSIKDSYWKELEGTSQYPQLWNMVDSPDLPLTFKGVEHEAITPDINSGAYYSYDLNRFIALYQEQGMPVMVSVSVQADTSEVGLKGAVVGDDSDWNYLYSGEKGVSISGLGWASTYMYEGYAVVIYCQVAPNKVKVGMFKWLKAGWSRMNMVKTKHIMNGMTRYSKDLKKIIESPLLPCYDQMITEKKRVGEFSDQELKKRVKPYVAEISNSKDPKIKKKPFSSMLANGTYLQNMQRKDMERVVLQEYMKCQLGLQPLLGGDYCVQYSALKQQKKPGTILE